MSQFEGTFQDSIETPAETSKLAITALILNLIFCCPCTTIPGTIIAPIAILTTMGNPRKKGTGLAIVALIIGIIAIVLSVVGYGFFQKNFIVPVFEGPRTVLQAGYDDDYQAFRDGMYGTGASASDEEIKAFIDELQSRYGEFESVRFDEAKQPPPGSGQPEQTFPYIITFSNDGSVSCDTTIIFADERTGGFVAPARPSEIVILDPDLGDIVFPPLDGLGGDPGESGDAGGDDTDDP